MAKPVSVKFKYDESLFLTLKEKADVFNTTHDKDIFSEFLKYFDTEEIKCKDCGKSVVYYDTTVKVANYAGNIIITLFGKNFFAEKAGSHLCICEDCLTKKYPDYQEKNKAKTFNRMNKFSQYAYNIPDDVYQRENLRLNSRSESSFISKWGEEEGKRKWEEYRKMCSDTNTFEYKKEKYGWTKEQFDKYNRSRAITVENLINKYGEEEGIRVWLNYIEKQSHKTPFGYSKKALKFFRELTPFLKENNIDIEGLKYKDDEYDLKEKHIVSTKRRKSYFLDYYLPKYNMCLEYYGNYYHCHPDLFKDENEFNKTINMKVKDKRDSDLQRIQILKEDYNIRTIVIWESDVDKNPRQVMDNILNEIQNGRK